VQGASGYFDGSTDYLTIASNTQTAPQSNNFTIELWVYLTNATANALQTFYSNYTDFGSAGSIYFGKHTINGGTVAVWLSTYSTGGPLLVESTLPPGNQWVHYALVRNGNTFSLYRNGTLSVSSTAYTGAATGSSNPNYIGAPGDITGSYNLPGYISDFRIVNGTAVYTSAFTPPTAPLTPIAGTQLLLPMNSAAIFDNSGMNNMETVGNAQIDTSVVKYGASSLYFDGSGDWLIPSGSSALYAFGTGDFTIEFWIYIPVTQTSIIYDSRPASTQGAYPELYLASNQINYYHSSAIQISGVTLANTTWYHIALCRSGTSTKLFVNGTQVGSTYTDSTNYLCGANRPIIGVAGNNLADPFNGYLDDLRVTKGVARYVTNFTPPVARMPNQ
jgi:hypothetical protein